MGVYVFDSGLAALEEATQRHRQGKDENDRSHEGPSGLTRGTASRRR